MRKQLLLLSELGGKNYLTSQTLADALGREHRYVVAQIKRTASNVLESYIYDEGFVRQNFICRTRPHNKNGLETSIYFLTQKAALLYAESIRPKAKREQVSEQIQNTFKGETAQ